MVSEIEVNATIEFFYFVLADGAQLLHFRSRIHIFEHRADFLKGSLRSRREEDVRGKPAGIPNEGAD